MNYKKIMIAAAAILTIGPATLVSCNKDADEDHIYSTQNFKKKSPGKLNLSSDEREAFAQVLAEELGRNWEAFSELNAAIQTVTEYGMDENLTMFDILNTEKSVFLESPEKVAVLRSILNDCKVLERYGFNVDDFYGELQFYWPYHDDWDKTITPVICFAPEDESAQTVTGYYYKDGDIIPVSLNEKIVDEVLLPVIVINQSETRYIEFPNFKNGEWKKNGKIWFDPSMPHPTEPISLDPSPAKLVYDAESVSLTSSGDQWDYWWAGGSEFEMVAVYARDESHLEVTTTAERSFSRKEIRKKATKDFGARIHNDWQPGLGDVYIRLVEKDDWGSVDPIDIHLDVAGNTLSTSININSTDDVVYSAPVSRDNYFYRCNYENGVLLLGGEKLNCSLRIYESFE